MPTCTGRGRGTANHTEVRYIICIETIQLAFRVVFAVAHLKFLVWLDAVEYLFLFGEDPKSLGAQNVIAEMPLLICSLFDSPCLHVQKIRNLKAAAGFILLPCW